jgi:nucleotide-binding universal stress UspA family protein
MDSLSGFIHLTISHILMRTVKGSLLCGVDFSEHSKRALRLARRLAYRLGEPLTVATALDPLLAQAAELRFGPGQFVRDTARDLEEFIAGSDPTGTADLANATARAVIGDAPSALLEVAAAERSSMVIVGTRGLGRAQRWWFGSTTAKLLRTSPVPILAVPDGERHEGLFARVVCAVDLDDPSTRPAEIAGELGTRLAMPVELLHTVRDVAVPAFWTPVLESIPQEAVAQARQRLDAIAAGLGKPVAVIVKRGEPVEVLTAHAASDPLALLVIGLGAPAHRPGTTAERLLAESHAPVLGVPPA